MKREEEEAERKRIEEAECLKREEEERLKREEEEAERKRIEEAERLKREEEEAERKRIEEAERLKREEEEAERKRIEEAECLKREEEERLERLKREEEEAERKRIEEAERLKREEEERLKREEEEAERKRIEEDERLKREEEERLERLKREEEEAERKRIEENELERLRLKREDAELSQEMKQLMMSSSESSIECLEPVHSCLVPKTPSSPSQEIDKEHLRNSSHSIHKIQHVYEQLTQTAEKVCSDSVRSTGNCGFYESSVSHPQSPSQTRLSVRSLTHTRNISLLSTSSVSLVTEDEDEDDVAGDISGERRDESGKSKKRYLKRNHALLGSSVSMSCITPPLNLSLIHKERKNAKALSSLWDQQRGRCHGCGSELSVIGQKDEFLFDNYTGALFCPYCFYGPSSETKAIFTHAIPSRMLKNADCTPMQVASVVHSFLSSTFRSPCVSDKNMSTKVRKKVKEFSLWRDKVASCESYIRQCLPALKERVTAERDNIVGKEEQLKVLILNGTGKDEKKKSAELELKEHKKTLSNDETFLASSRELLMALNDMNPHLPESMPTRSLCMVVIETNLYKLDTIRDILVYGLTKKMKRVWEMFISHLKTPCYYCLGHGFICPVCNKGDPLYPFSNPSSFVQCRECGILTHTKCWSGKCISCDKLRKLDERKHTHSHK
ncbi:hypothetical protein ADUPG1_011577 [Aduncisulcus paluster]|uniref:Rubicon Homology domain-containing protein n=1 Tax=Aduncisulcus paluster TaxID=2918883 RepID=A0ABQ5JW83_9EUKA|nr:hypothetical protein ADUPG1_011577 [Aduncisulcus paluster]